MSKSDRIELLRGYMAGHGLSAYIFPSTDPHCGEYIPEHWMGRQWISEFDGSAGTAVVTLHDAALWTDSRYFLAAESQLAGTPFCLMRDGLPGTPDIAEWLCRVLPQGSVIGMDGWVNTVSGVREMSMTLKKAGYGVETSLDPLAEIWADRPSVPLSPVVIHPIEYAGERAKDKLSRLRAEMRKEEAESVVISQLDEVAWLTNLRGTDVRCNPVFVAYLTVSVHDAVLYVNPCKVSAEVVEYLAGEGISCAPYSSFPDALRNYKEESVIFDPSSTCSNVAALLPEKVRKVEHTSLVAPMKAVKNNAEIRGFRNAMVRDGVAMVKFLKWLLPAVEKGHESELSVSRKLEALRSEQPLYRGVSFDTIAGYAAHGAIVHYEPTEKSDIPLLPKGLLLLDSGAQYADGTTDITRTIALGPLTEQERLDYTLVLKGHIRLALACFPKGTCGTQLDVLARYAMWQKGINFLHGTGHGVGSYLNVHEGPHQIRMNYKPAPLLPGTTVTDEPGIYRSGAHGVRIENTMIVENAMTTDFGQFLRLDALTLCPIDTAPIMAELMMADEVDYLNDYHQRVLRTLSPHLTDEERTWLENACQPLCQIYNNK